MAEVDTSFYPKASNPLDTLTKVVGAIGGMNQNKLFEQTFQARQNVGEAYKANTNPDGTLNEEGLRRDLGRSGFGAGEALGQGISNTKANFELNKARNDYMVTTFGSMVNDKNLTGAGAVGKLLDLSRNAGIPLAMVQPLIKDVQNDRDPNSVRTKIGNFQNLALGTQGAARVEGPPVPGTNAPTTVPLASQTGGPTVGLPPGVKEGAVAAATPSAGLLAQHRADSSNYRRQVFPLEQAIPALEKLGKTGTGPGTEEANNIKSFLQSVGVPGIDANKIKTFDEAHKYLTDWVRANGDNSTNDKLAASFSSNASTKISNAAAIDVAKSALSLRRMQQAQTAQFENSGLPESDYAKWASKWNSRQDPRVYGFDLMTPAQRQNVLKSLPAAKRDAFMLDVQKAEEAGVLNPPNAK